MTSRTRHARTTRLAAVGQRGFALVAVLVLSGLMATLAATYSHHLLAGNRSSLASPDALRAREICSSHLEVARQALLTGSSVQGEIVDADGSVTTLSVVATADDARSILVRTELPGGEWASKLVSATLLPDPSSSPAGPNALPHWPDATVAALLADDDVPKLHIESDTLLAGVDLLGLLVVHDGVTLRLDDVVLSGAVVSERALTEGDLPAFDALQAPELVVAGNLRIDALPGVPAAAILMPDGVVNTSGTSARVQFAGDVIAHTVNLSSAGLLTGKLLSVMSPNLGDDLDLIGSERTPSPWSIEFEFGDVWDTSTVAVTPAYSTIASLSAITQYWSQH